ncbi:MAG: cellulose biosynthesis cyclic di-GMP-binding regulatory protein BcsB [Candidatus Eremiobacteraeota bacterium]|nr:cellulose biosynthesis cyclic di-GMP-binding regulatory protein BcsB [Candidatus Eremiobacteraeota bacterium]
MRSLIACCVVAFFAALAAQSTANASEETTVSFSDLGYLHGTTTYGPNPHVALRLPIYPGTRSAQLLARVTLSPIADSRSSVVLTIDGHPVATTSAAQLRRDPMLTAQLPLSSVHKHFIDVALDAYLSDGGSVCTGPDPHAMWVRIDPSSMLKFTRDPQPPTVATFFDDYRGRFDVSIARNASPSTRALGITMAYWLHQINRWRYVTAHFGTRDPIAHKNIVVGDFIDALSVSGDTMRVSPSGIQLLAARASDLMISSTARIGTLTQYPQEFHHISFQDIGVLTETINDSGLYEVPIRFTLGEIGGMPNDLHLVMDLTHSSFPTEDRASIDLTLNGFMVNSFPLDARAREESFDAPIDDRFIRASNDVRVTVNYLPGRRTCESGHPGMLLTVMPDSGLQWRAVQHVAPSVSDFFNNASGRVIVLYTDAQALAAASNILDRLGSMNDSVAWIDVRPYTGTIPEGYDYAVVVGARSRPGSYSSYIDPSKQTFALRTLNNRVVFRAQLNESYGILETVDANKTPTLLFTYIGNPNIMNGLAAIDREELAEAQADVFVYDASGVAFSPHDYIVALHTSPADNRLAILPVLPFFGLVSIVALTWVSMRARKAS